ncbi:MAG: hypothetical protein JXR95_03430 [Deltaproteobacteria bacterium]|nr:hypothetical protein [Deltaproteobacteria bacterium]
MTWKRYSLFMSGGFILLPLLSFLVGYLSSVHTGKSEPSIKVKEELVRIFHEATNGKSIELSTFSEYSDNYPGPLFVNIIHRGKFLFHCEEAASPLADAVRKCRDKIIKMSPYPSESRIRIDLALSFVRIPHVPQIRSLLILPGVEAIKGNANGLSRYILPDEMYFDDFLAGSTPLSFVKELKIGVNIEKLEKELSLRLGRWPDSIYRVKLMSLVNGYTEPDKMREVFRSGLKKRKKVTSDSVYKAALAGGDYMLRSLVKNPRRKIPCTGKLCRGKFFRTTKGQFVYNYWITKGAADFQNKYIYNLPRHAGTTYALANLFRITGLKRFGDGASIAISYLRELADGNCRGPGFRCVSSGGWASLGSSALALVAVTEYFLATGDSTYNEFGQSLAGFLLYMQRPDGSFMHHYNVRKMKPDKDRVDLYYSGEASLALAKSWKAWKKPEYLKAAEKGVDWLTTEQVKPLPFRFAFGEEHWTCQAARELYPDVNKKRYIRFCTDFANYIERQQWKPDETEFPDYIGTYGFTPVVPAHSNGAGSRTEANVSTFELIKFNEQSTKKIENQIRLALSHIINNQRNPENCWLCKDPEYSSGAVTTSPVQLDVRIDTVQHTTTGLIRAWASLYK